MFLEAEVAVQIFKLLVPLLSLGNLDIFVEIVQLQSVDFFLQGLLLLHEGLAQALELVKLLHEELIIFHGRSQYALDVDDLIVLLEQLSLELLEVNLLLLGHALLLLRELVGHLQGLLVVLLQPIPRLATGLLYLELVLDPVAETLDEVATLIVLLLRLLELHILLRDRLEHWSGHLSLRVVGLENLGLLRLLSQWHWHLFCSWLVLAVVELLDLDLLAGLLLFRLLEHHQTQLVLLDGQLILRRLAGTRLVNLQGPSAEAAGTVRVVFRLDHIAAEVSFEVDIPQHFRLEEGVVDGDIALRQLDQLNLGTVRELLGLPVLQHVL